MVYVYNWDAVFTDDHFVSAKKASSPAELVSTLLDLGLSSSGETKAFAQQIFSQVEHKASGPNVSAVV